MSEQQAICKRPGCNNPLEQKDIGPYKKTYCSNACKQAVYRASHHNVTVDIEAQQRIVELETELAGYREIMDLSDRQKMVTEFMDTGQIIGWLALRSIDLNPGEYAWREYTRRADDKQMAIALAGARNMYKVIKDLQTTEEVARLNNLVAVLRQKLRDCEKHNRRDSS